MPKDTAIDLNLISTEELVDELTERHEEIIIIREDRIHSEWLNIRAKTGFGKYGCQEAEFDIVLVIRMLHDTIRQLLIDHLKAVEDGDDNT